METKKSAADESTPGPRKVESPARAPSPVFIHRQLDDYGLTPIQFRVYGHIARREGPDGCWAGADSMARVCRVNPNSLWPALRFLEDHRLIEGVRRPGDTTIYRITPLSSWVPRDDPPQNNRRVGRPKIREKGAKTTTHPEIMGGTHTERIGTHPPQSNRHKGSPSEGTPSEGTPEETGCWRTPVFQKDGKNSKSRPKFVGEVLKFALTHAHVPGNAVDKWLTPSLKRILRQPATATIAEQKDNETARDALARAFRFIYYNNRKGWQLTASWQAAFSGFAEKADHGCGPADVPVDWIPNIESIDGEGQTTGRMDWHPRQDR